MEPKLGDGGPLEVIQCDTHDLVGLSVWGGVLRWWWKWFMIDCMEQTRL